MTKLVLPTLIAAAALLAGCATPEESVDDGGDGGLVFTPQPQLVRINSMLYTCDETLSNDDVCDEYVLADDQQQDASGAVDATVQDDGTVLIEGRAYRCDDSADVGFDDGGGADGNETAGSGNDTIDTGQQTPDENGPGAGGCEEYLLADEA